MVCSIIVTKRIRAVQCTEWESTKYLPPRSSHQPILWLFVCYLQTNKNCYLFLFFSAKKTAEFWFSGATFPGNCSSAAFNSDWCFIQGKWKVKVNLISTRATKLKLQQPFKTELWGFSPIFSFFLFVLGRSTWIWRWRAILGSSRQFQNGPTNHFL